MIHRISQRGPKNIGGKLLFYINGGNNSGRDTNYWLNFHLELIYEN